MNTKGKGLVRAVVGATVVAGLTLASAVTQAGQMGGNSAIAGQLGGNSVKPTGQMGGNSAIAGQMGGNSVKPTGQMGGNSVLKSVASGLNGTAKPIAVDATCGAAVSLLDPNCI